MTASVSHAEVEAFVAAVRRELSDLTSEEIDELTGGLEADLEDAIAENPSAPGESAVDRFGSPASYAAELRAAAGLSPRAAGGGRRGASPIDGTREAWRSVRAWLDRQGWWGPTKTFLLAIRPAWWVARAGLLAMVLLGSAYQGLTGALVVTFGALLVLSVQAGRQAWARRNGWLRAAVFVANALAILYLPTGVTLTTTPNQVYVDNAVPPANGLWLNGTEVRNIFPYDSNGNPLTDVQLLDENGHPLAVGTSAREPIVGPQGAIAGQDRGSAQIPALDERGQAVWNVFPLRQQEGPFVCCDANGNSTIAPEAAPTDGRRPRASLGRVGPPALTQPAPSTSPTSAPSAAPSAVTSISPSPTASATR